VCFIANRPTLAFDFLGFLVPIDNISAEGFKFLPVPHPRNGWEVPDHELHDPFEPPEKPAPDDPGGVPDSCRLNPQMCGGRTPFSSSGCSNPSGEFAELRLIDYRELSRWHPPCRECVKFTFRTSICAESRTAVDIYVWRVRGGRHTVVFCTNQNTGHIDWVEL